MSENNTSQEAADAAWIAHLIARGYRRTSNRHCMLSRIDRPDYLEHMAAKMCKAPADFMEPMGRAATGGWDDHYRRVYSKDKIIVPQRISARVPSSGHCATGYLP